MSETPFMPKATAVWLVENTTLTFKQIATFCNLHELEIKGIADGDVAKGIKAYNPILAGQLSREEIDLCSKDPDRNLNLVERPEEVQVKERKKPKYTPLSKRQDRPDAALWLLKNYPEFTDGQISKLVGTTKPTIQAIRERTHWNITNIDPIDPVALGLCRQSELDALVQKANAKKPGDDDVMSDDERRKLVSTEQSLGMPDEPRIPAAISGLETFTLADAPKEEESHGDLLDAESFFNLPSDDKE